MTTHCPKPRTAAKKPYVSPEIWALRTAKLQSKKQLKEHIRLLARETSVRIFVAWKLHKSQADHHEVDSDSNCLDLSFNYGTSLRCFAVKLSVRFLTEARKLRDCLKTAKQQLLNQTIAEITPETPAGRIQQILRPFTGPSNKLRQGMPPLPAIKDQQGNWCHKADDT